MADVRVALCSGKDCRKRCEYKPLRQALSAVADVAAVKCLDLCDSPVVVVLRRGHEAMVFDKVRSDRQRADLVAMIQSGRPPTARLADRVVVGKRRKHALAALG